ncbi:MAG TPA: DoxX family protein [Pseudolabrys sp.]|nr:DoxX family protein [Pseudolabrys sp.]
MLKSLEAQLAPYTLAALRVVSGALFLAHGLVKTVGFPAGAQPGLQPLMSVFGVGGVIEIVTGVLLIVGLYSRAAAFIASGEMAVGYWLFHAPASFYPVINGGDAAILFSFIFLNIAAMGPGAFSLDTLLGRDTNSQRLTLASATK